jgi:hypothetical protein
MSRVHHSVYYFWRAGRCVHCTGYSTLHHRELILKLLLFVRVSRVTVVTLRFEPCFMQRTAASTITRAASLNTADETPPLAHAPTYLRSTRTAHFVRRRTYVGRAHNKIKPIKICSLLGTPYPPVFTTQRKICKRIRRHRWVVKL